MQPFLKDSIDLYSSLSMCRRHVSTLYNDLLAKLATHILINTRDVIRPFQFLTAVLRNSLVTNTILSASSLDRISGISSKKGKEPQTDQKRFRV